MNRSRKEYLILALKGLSMGAADVIPGVSGGTIAFITGIYEELIHSLKSINGEALHHLRKMDIAGFWQQINGSFLTAVLAGIGVSIVALSRVILFLLEHYPVLIWSFFLGLILASAVSVARKIKTWNLGTALSMLVGAALAWWITMVSPAETPEALWFIFLSGAIAICAMILPGISGSFILLLLGKYQYVLGALRELNFAVIITFAAGCATGLISFSHLLSWMFRKFHDLTVALLAGFMVGSLNKVWPWKHTVQFFTDSKGNLKPLIQDNVLPDAYSQITGEPSFLTWAMILTIVGIVLILVMERFAPESKNQE